MELRGANVERPWTFRGTISFLGLIFIFDKVHGKSTEIHGIRQIPWIPYVKVGDCKVLHVSVVHHVGRDASDTFIARASTVRNGGNFFFQKN